MTEINSRRFKSCFNHAHECLDQVEDDLPYSMILTSLSKVRRKHDSKENATSPTKERKSFKGSHYKSISTITLPKLSTISPVDLRKTKQKAEKVFKDIQEKVSKEIKFKTKCKKIVEKSKRENELDYEDYSRKEKWERDLHVEDWMKNRNKLVAGKLTIQQKIHLKSWFDVLDTDGSGEISLDELQDPLLSVGLAETKKDIQNLIERVDTDGSGEIGFEEFLVVIEEASKLSISRKTKGKNIDSDEDEEVVDDKDKGIKSKSKPKQKPDDHLPKSHQAIIPRTRKSNDSNSNNYNSIKHNNKDSGSSSIEDGSGAAASHPARSRTEQIRTSLFGGDESMNPLVQIHQYHLKSGFGNFNVAIGLCRRKMLLDAVKEYNEVTEKFLLLQEEITKKEKNHHPISIYETRTVENLSRRRFELKRYMDNMNRIINQYLDEDTQQKEKNKFLTKHDKFEQMMRKRSEKRRNKVDSYGIPVFDLTRFLTEKKAKDALVEEKKLEFLNDGTEVDEDENEDLNQDVKDEKNKKDNQCDKIYEKDESENVRFNEGGGSSLETESRIGRNIERESCDYFYDMDLKDSISEDDIDNPLMDWYEESGLSLQRLGTWS